MLLSAAGGLEPLLPNDPDIAPAGSDPGSPFSLPFIIKNGSLVFAMHNVSITCVVEHALTNIGGTMDNVGITKYIGTIERKDSTSVDCGIVLPFFSIHEATLHIEQTYNLGWLGKRTYSTQTFVWTRTSDGGRWMKGLSY